MSFFLNSNFSSSHKHQLSFIKFDIEYISIVKVENGQTKSRPVPSVFLYLSRSFLYLRKNTEMEREAGGVYPVRICGIPFLTGIMPYFFRICKIREKIIGTPYILSCFSISIHIFHGLIVGNKKY